MIRADLHIHSQYSSDGEFRPADIVGKCAAGGVDLFSLTDHNTVRGLDEACDGALHAGLEFVPGIEIDCSFEVRTCICWAMASTGSLPISVRWKRPSPPRSWRRSARRSGSSVGWASPSMSRPCWPPQAAKLPTMELIAEVMLSDAACDTPLPGSLPGGRRARRYALYQLLPRLRRAGQARFRPGGIYELPRRRPSWCATTGAWPVVAHPDSTCGAGSVSSRSCWSAGPRDWKFSIITTMIGRSPISRRWSGAVGP